MPCSTRWTSPGSAPGPRATSRRRSRGGPEPARVLREAARADPAGLPADRRAARAGPHQVGLVLRHAPVFRNLAEIVHSGRYGKPMALVLRDDQYFPIQGMYGSTWRSDVDKAGGGTLIEHSIHDLDVINWVLGPPESVSAHTASIFGYPGIDDSAALRLAYPGGATAVARQRVAPGHDPAVHPPPRALLRGGVPLDRGRLPRPAARRDLGRSRGDRR